MSRPRLELTIMPNGKRSRHLDDSVIRRLATLVRGKKASAPQTQHSELVDKILEAIETGAPLPSRAKHFRGPEFEPVGDEAFEGVDYAEGLCYERLQRTSAGASAMKALRKCSPNNEDAAHFDGPDGELLRAIIDGDCESRIEVMRAASPFNPVG